MALTSLLAVTRQGLTIKISSTVWTWAARRWTWVVSPAYPLGRLLYRRSPIRVQTRTISLTPCPMMIISTRRNDPVAIPVVGNIFIGRKISFYTFVEVLANKIKSKKVHVCSVKKKKQEFRNFAPILGVLVTIVTLDVPINGIWSTRRTYLR
uniref:Uncharacterized protein n=2 Tax=Cacopsylla melanoneura TaxID=428564 RepID=A0A8D8Y5W4_9HEMI